ncbi:MAG: hypothetical protein ACOC44_06855 [Promethearchaeia archaeon]
MKKPDFKKFVKKVKEKVDLENLKEKFQKVGSKIKDLSLSNYKIDRLQKHINNFDSEKKQKPQDEEEEDYSFLKGEFDDLSSDLDKMMSEINTEKKEVWETIPSFHSVTETKYKGEEKPETKNHYWKRSLKKVINHYLNNGNNFAILRFQKSPYCFQYPILSRMFQKVKELK